MTDARRNILAITPEGVAPPFFNCTKTDEGFVFSLRNPATTEGMCGVTAGYVLDRSEAMMLAQSLVDDLMRHHD